VNRQRSALERERRKAKLRPGRRVLAVAVRNSRLTRLQVARLLGLTESQVRWTELNAINTLIKHARPRS
jgi:hypothetical protein